MLDWAINYVEQLTMLHRKSLTNEKYKYLDFSSYQNLNINISDSTWECIQKVSVDREGKIHGYLKANLNRSSDIVTGLTVMNFDSNYIFSKDMYQFIDELFTIYNFRKIKFYALADNPANKMYEKVIKRLGGRVVGVFKEEIKSCDNKYYDEVNYEIMREDYINNIK